MDITYLGNSSFRIKGKATVVVVETNGSISIADRAEGRPYGIRGPGEYEINGVGVIGVSVGGSTVYRMEIDGISIVHLGSVCQKLSSTQVDTLDGVEILLVPVGDAAVSVVSEIEPSIVIPMNYAPDQLRVFLKEIGKEEIVPSPKLTISKDKIPEQMQVVVLE